MQPSGLVDADPVKLIRFMSIASQGRKATTLTAFEDSLNELLIDVLSEGQLR